MKNRFQWMFSWIVIGMITFLSSCTSDSNKNAFVQVRLTDAPGDYQEVNIDIQGVQINADANSNSGWQSLVINKGVYNLLKFTNGLDTLLGTTSLPAGKVSQIRLVLGSNNTVKVGGQSYSLSTPSSQQSGLKILVNTQLQEGITYKITLDFDAAHSIVLTGNSNYILKPVIHSIVESESGAIKGTVQPAVSRPAVYAIQGTDTVETAYADSVSGKFLLRALVAGPYTVGFAPKTGYLPKSVDNVSVTTGVVTDMGTVQITQ